MLYLPRLFVYHCNAELGSVQSETFKVMSVLEGDDHVDDRNLGRSDCGSPGWADLPEAGGCR